MIWAAARQNQQNDLCAQRRLRSDWASPGICPVWSESWLSAHWVAKVPRFLHADSEDSDQMGRMPSLFWVFAEHTDHFVGFVMLQLFLIFWKSFTFFEEEKKIYLPTNPFSFIWYDLACMAWYMLWPGEAWHGIWYDLVDIAWFMVWPGAHGMVYGMALWASRGLWYGLVYGMV